MRTALEAELLGLVASARASAAEDPFASPALAVALALSRRMDDGDLPLEDLAAVLDRLGRAAFRDRAARLAAAVGGADPATADAALAALASRAARPDADDSPVGVRGLPRRLRAPPRRGGVHRAPDLLAFAGSGRRPRPRRLRRRRRAPTRPSRRPSAPPRPRWTPSSSAPPPPSPPGGTRSTAWPRPSSPKRAPSGPSAGPGSIPAPSCSPPGSATTPTGAPTSAGRTRCGCACG